MLDLGGTDQSQSSLALWQWDQHTCSRMNLACMVHCLLVARPKDPNIHGLCRRHVHRGAAC